MKDSKYINFNVNMFKPKKRTFVWAVISKHHGDLLGAVEWYAPWRQYCFVSGDLVFSKGCLAELGAFIEEHEKDRVVAP